MANIISSKLLFTRTISAASIAISVPAPIAIPTSAATSAVPQLSPVTMMPLIFIDLSMETTSLAPGFSGSDTAKTPAISLSMDTRIPV
ncbi:hypothetical protein L6164_028219 [Bauhinia variegata]|uniref:Uncharacterized protein n=1 Tax=Bauhinia variegata TaxID=167791 RepID=A0ACB9LVI6_BAUVA|nr:hypothetical protein L6164_028219 [Bauhinia variegata]